MAGEEESMIRLICAMCVVLSVTAVEALADSSTTRPTITVAVMPLNVQGDAGGDWLGRAMQEGLATGLRQASGVSGVIVAGLAPIDSSSAIAMAKSADADAVIFGDIQIIGGQMRVTGQIISMRTGQSLGALRSDGSEEDLFKMEDLLADRVERILAPPPANRPATTGGHGAELPLIGPTVASGATRYFDGNLMAQLTPPARDRDEYDKYYYQTADTSSFAGCCGAPWGAWGCGLGCFGGGGCPVIATPVSGW